LREADQRFSRHVKLFVSSTFTDTVAERNFLLEHVYPMVQKWTNSEFNVQFSAVDL